MHRAYSLEKSSMLGKVENKSGSRGQRMRCWMASPTQWTWVWASAGKRWRAGKPGVLQSMGLKSQTGMSNRKTATVIQGFLPSAGAHTPSVKCVFPVTVFPFPGDSIPWGCSGLLRHSFYGTCISLNTYHFVSHWILSVTRHQVPEVHWERHLKNSGFKSQPGFWLSSSPNLGFGWASSPDLWVQVSSVLCSYMYISYFYAYYIKVGTQQSSILRIQILSWNHPNEGDLLYMKLLNCWNQNLVELVWIS